MKAIHRVYNHLIVEYHVGRLLASETSILVEMSKCQVHSKDILISLNQKNPKNACTTKTIHNTHKYRVIEQGRKSHMQYLLLKVSKYKCIKWHRRCPQNYYVIDLCLDHTMDINLLRAFLGIIIIDCAYKTNMYTYPLLETIGIMSTNMLFAVTLAFLEREKEVNYAWGNR